MLMSLPMLWRIGLLKKALPITHIGFSHWLEQLLKNMIPLFLRLKKTEKFLWSFQERNWLKVNLMLLLSHQADFELHLKHADIRHGIAHLLLLSEKMLLVQHFAFLRHSVLIQVKRSTKRPLFFVQWTLSMNSPLEYFAYLEIQRPKKSHHLWGQNKSILLLTEQNIFKEKTWYFLVVPYLALCHLKVKSLKTTILALFVTELALLWKMSTKNYGN